MSIELHNTLKAEKGWYQSFQLLPSISFYKNVDDGSKAIYLSWTFLCLGFYWDLKN